MVRDQPGVDCVMDQAGRPVAGASRVDRKDRGPGLAARKADARTDICLPECIRVAYSFWPERQRMVAAPLI